MKNNNLKSKTIKQLQSKLSFSKATTAALVIVLILLTAISIYGLVAKDDVKTFITLFAVGCTSWSFLPLPFNSMKEIKTELKLRVNTN